MGEIRLGSRAQPRSYDATELGPIAGTALGQYGPFRALRCPFLDERERIEARSV